MMSASKDPKRRYQFFPSYEIREVRLYEIANFPAYNWNVVLPVKLR